MRQRSYVVAVAVVVIVVAAAIALRGQGAETLRRWLPAIHGHK